MGCRTGSCTSRPEIASSRRVSRAPRAARRRLVDRADRRGITHGTQRGRARADDGEQVVEVVRDPVREARGEVELVGATRHRGVRLTRRDILEDEHRVLGTARGHQMRAHDARRAVRQLPRPAEVVPSGTLGE